MEIRYTPELMEKVIMEEMRRREVQGNASLTNLYQNKVEPLYELDEEARTEMFAKVHAEFFSKFGFDKMMRKILEEFSRVDKVVSVFVVQAEEDEEADLVGEEGKPELILIRLRPESFLQPALLNKVLKHELMHVSDMLDEDFGYRMERLGNSLVEEMTVKDKYRLLWDIYIDSRLERRGAGQEAKELRFAEFERLYQKIPEQHRNKVFEALWSTQRMTHSELLELAKEPRKLLEKAGIALDKKTILLPGMLCPLCKFPTYNWEEVQSVEPEVIRAIKQDFPAWGLEQGACERCVETYRAREKGW